MAYNVEYQLQALKCKPRALDDAEMELIADLKSMDEVLTRPTPDAQRTSRQIKRRSIKHT
jgi:hypothetical protein